MSTVAILGAGPIGAAVAHRLAQRSRVRVVRLIDGAGAVAAGKALDIRQSGPIDRFDTVVESADDPRAAATASVIVVADDVGGGEWQGDAGLSFLRHLVEAGVTAPIVFAGAAQTWLIEAAYRELKVPAARLIGSAAGALAGAVRALAGLELGLASVDLAVVGRPPSFVIGWTAASAQGLLVTDRVPAHRLLAISTRHGETLATGAVRHRLGHRPDRGSADRREPVAALRADDCRRRPRRRGAAVVLPLELGRGRVLSHLVPSLSAQERTEFLNAIARA